ncbi:MAG: glycogen synthase [Armatimonadetes bacterium]|nr:glycogen synthase [Armatimonadota bacterium]
MGLKVLIVSVEVAPFAKVGGLADVAASLPKALRAMGHDARIVMPAYGKVLHETTEPVREVVKPFDTQVNPYWRARTTLHETSSDGVPVWLLNGVGLFEHIHTSEQIYSPNRDAYLFFSRAILAACEKAGWIPDIIHCNDWHTGFVPVMLRELAGPEWDETASVFTIHNLAYQGEFGQDTLDAAGLPQSLFTMDKLETFGGVNFIKSGCVYADQVNTVSPNYAKEITTEEYGFRQWGLMRDLDKLGRLRGILNGIDTDFFNPSTDKALTFNYSADDLTGKARCKETVQRELGLSTDPNVPLMSVISRLSDQKGFDQLIRTAYGILGLPAQWVVLAVGDPWAAGELHKLQAEWPDRFRFIERFDAPLAQRLYAGSDIFLMPSNFEPCGLGQLIAMRYGTVPMVRRTGGLADTVFDGENGFVYEHKDPRDMFDTITRAAKTFVTDKPKWNELVRTGMTTDFGWEERAQEYVKMYQDALLARKTAAKI